MVRLPALLLALCALIVAVPAMAQADGRLIEWERVTSAHVGPRNISIWLPPGYDRTRRRYPVIYMHDGQNLFVPGRAYGGEEWGMDEALSHMIASGRTHGAIVVGVWNTNLRGREYLPTAVAAALPAAARERVEATHGGGSIGNAYLRFLVTELKPRIDTAFRTRPGRRDTSIMGSSMGGLISLYALGQYPRVFGQAAALSIHWPLGDPREGAGASVEDVSGAFAAWLAASRVDPRRNRLYVDIGDQTLDAFYPPYQRQLIPVLTERGWRHATGGSGCGATLSASTFPGTAHNEAAWRSRIEQPLAFLLQRC